LITSPGLTGAIDTIDPKGISVILCARNEAALIANQLEALTRQNPGVPWELIVVDNGSSDDTVVVAEGFSERLEMRVLLESSANLPRARNVGVAAARHPLIAHCDADDEVSEGWLAAIVEGLRRSSLVTGPLDEVALNDANDSWQRPPLPSEEAPVSNRFLPFAVGANIAYRRVVHTTLGGWDETFRAGAGDDVDFSWRAQHEGFELAFCRDAVVRYRHRVSGLGLARQFLRYGAADPLLFRRHAHCGMQRQKWRQVVERWLGLIATAPRAVVVREQRSAWLITASWSVGRIRGSIRYRSIFL
jgi:glycosyltransferase involved in cell wall biosynthesis